MTHWEDCDCWQCERAQEDEAIKTAIARWNWNASPCEIAREIRDDLGMLSEDRWLDAIEDAFGEGARFAVQDALDHI